MGDVIVLKAGDTRQALEKSVTGKDGQYVHIGWGDGTATVHDPNDVLYRLYPPTDSKVVQPTPDEGVEQGEVQ